jgi:DNA-binding FadR family transcriptional regulator
MPADLGTLKPLAVPPAYELVLNRLRRAIHLGIYGPGDKLPPERAHAEQLGISRVTLREAIRVLEGEGYVETRRGSMGGVTVLDRKEPPVQLRRRLREDIEQLRAVADFRLANERCAAERAATRVDEDDIAALARAIDALRDSTSVGNFRQADSFFHVRIAEAADCELLRQAVEDARAAMFMPLDALDFELIHSSSVRDHEKILQALKGADAAKAGRAMASHLRHTNDELDAELSRAD